MIELQFNARKDPTFESLWTRPMGEFFTSIITGFYYETIAAYRARHPPGTW
jgi:hypothetical protein